MSGADRAELGRRLLDRAYLEGDFLLRSGRRSRYYLDKYRFETEPALLAGLGREIAALQREHAPEAELLAGPELGAVPLAAATSMEAGLPFVIVRKAAKDYGTANRLEGVYAAGQRVCVVEDVVTSGGALLDAVAALREAELDVCAAICVVDREEGGAEAIAAAGVAFHPLFTSSDLGVGSATQSA
ncbi:MAG TPA: orotate phosphoribosyltransferase [Gaiellales bacterium]|nr:orotate phosphoribosyltransferase [Gaiellales bacterium]